MMVDHWHDCLNLYRLKSVETQKHQFEMCKKLSLSRRCLLFHGRNINHLDGCHGIDSEHSVVKYSIGRYSSRPQLKTQSPAVSC